jgi:hypothetical protein
MYRYRTLTEKYGTIMGSYLRHFCMLSRRLDDRIRRLSEQAIGASSNELEEILPKLLAAIHEKLERLRTLAANRFLGGRHPSERRATRQ